ncbi:MAG TPA: hypothetical protein VGI12_21435 [Vicinamibacterales bacterium]|jgi:hypothetical protein
MSPRAVLAAAAAMMLLAQSAGAPPSYNSLVRDRILAQTGVLLHELASDKRDLKIDGTPVFNGNDKFLPGKIAIAFADYLVSRPHDDPGLAEDLAAFRAIARLTINDANETWGTYYYVLAIDRLRTAGLLDRALDDDILATLRTKLDWTPFVEPGTYRLIDHPNNYYVVALAIARLRHHLGWEDATAADAIYRKAAEHYERYSGDFGFADETDGEGRFDRYSVLLAGELANHFVETGDRPPAEALTRLRQSSDVMLQRLHEDGTGFEYGRSLGPYGETAIVETLTAAARLGVLTDAERTLAYSYATKVAQRYVDFWMNPDTGSVNMWDAGRRTDAYRGKFRILGENLSLAHQFAYTNDGWNAMGFTDRPVMDGFAAALERRPARSVTWFSRGTYDRVLVTRRDGERIIGLPLVNGGATQHMHHPYFPIPFSQGMLEGVPDGGAPILVPRFTLADGAQLMPLAFIRDVKVDDTAAATTVTYRQSEMDRLGKSAPVADDRMAATTTYTLLPHRLVRRDVFTPAAGLDVASIQLEYAGFSREPAQDGLTTRFGAGVVTSFSVNGLERCTARSLDHDRDYASDTGPMTALVVCTTGAVRLEGPLTITWTLEYR